MVKRITAAAVKAATARTPWALGDDVLYDLCRTHPHHNDRGAIWVKVMFIGRVYAAAIERRKIHRDVPNETFYEEHVVPKIHESEIDRWIAKAKRQMPGTPEALKVMIEVHGQLTGLFNQITDLDKRSLASKYLHFHVPTLFFIYDSQAVKALRTVSEVAGRASPFTGDGDREYAWFAEKCARLTQHCESKFGVHLQPRALDILLLGIANKVSRPTVPS